VPIHLLEYARKDVEYTFLIHLRHRALERFMKTPEYISRNARIAFYRSLPKFAQRLLRKHIERLEKDLRDRTDYYCTQYVEHIMKEGQMK
jgi:undecaprenyl pyrophosphate synthase